MIVMDFYDYSHMIEISYNLTIYITFCLILHIIQILFHAMSKKKIVFQLVSSIFNLF